MHHRFAGRSLQLSLRETKHFLNNKTSCKIRHCETPLGPTGSALLFLCLCYTAALRATIYDQHPDADQHRCACCVYVMVVPVYFAVGHFYCSQARAYTRTVATGILPSSASPPELTSAAGGALHMGPARVLCGAGAPG